MWGPVARLLTPPTFEDRDKTRKAATLYRVLLGGMAVSLVNAALSFNISPIPARSVAVNGAVCALIALPMWIVRRGRLRLATIVLTASLWLTLTAVGVFLVGLSTPILGTYVAVAIFVGFSAGVRAVVGYSILTAAFILAAAWAESHELMPSPVTVFTPYTAWLSLAAGLALTSILIILSLRDTREALGEARRSERAALEASRAVAAGRALLEARARQQATVAELGQLALANTPPSELMGVAAKAVAHTLAVDFVSVLEHVSGEDAFALRAGVGWDEELSGTVDIPRPLAGQAGQTLTVIEPVVIDDWSEEKRFPMPPIFRERGVVSSLAVAIQGVKEPYGVFAAHSTARRRYTHDDVHFLQSVANLLTLVIRRESADEALRRSEGELRQSQKMEAIGRLAGGIAHDFNNLLTAISGYNSILMRRMESSDPGREDAQEIERAAERAASLTQQILAFSRRQVLQPEVLDLNEIIRKTKGMLERIIGEDVALSIDLAPDLAAVRADPGQIEQVLMNLAVNARDAMPRGGRLEIATENAELGPSDESVASSLDPGDYAQLTVSDTGVGMAAETRARIFEPFFTTKGLSEGTGLGLSTVYGIVNQSGGGIRVDSEPGRWTRFVIHLPRCDDVPAESAATDRSGTPRGSETVLIAEDDPGVRRLTRRMLEELGYAVLEAEDGVRALALAKDFDGSLPLLLTDVIMPDLGGVELVARLNEIRPETRVVYVTGYADDALGKDVELPSRTAFLPKPFTQEELARKLRDVLDG
jgi:signal transduction histidine kinase/CheY-like chemotaxis protein